MSAAPRRKPKKQYTGSTPLVIDAQGIVSVASAPKEDKR